MATRQNDIKLDSGFDLDIEGGDFVMDESTAQAQMMLLLNGDGDFKQNPTACVDAFKFKDDDEDNLEGEIVTKFAADGMVVKKAQLESDGSVTTDAYYK